MDNLNKLKRYVVYSSHKDKRYLCVVMATDSKHAIKIAKQNFKLSKTAWATKQTTEDIIKNLKL